MAGNLAGTSTPAADTNAVGVNTAAKLNPPTSPVMEAPESLVEVNKAIGSVVLNEYFYALVFP